MKIRFALPLLALAACFALAPAQDAKAFEFLDRMLGINGYGHGCGSCCAAPSCCEPTCCAPVACEPSCCAAPACEPSCCAPAPSCCAPRCHRHLFRCCHKIRRCHRSCCEPVCCEPSCCAPAPSCGCGG